MPASLSANIWTCIAREPSKKRASEISNVHAPRTHCSVPSAPIRNRAFRPPRSPPHSRHLSPAQEPRFPPPLSPSALLRPLPEEGPAVHAWCAARRRRRGPARGSSTRAARGVKKRALHECEQRGHLRVVKYEPVRTRVGVSVGVRRGRRRGSEGEEDVRVPGALCDVPLGVARGHAPAAQDALDLLRGRDFAEVEEDLCAQGLHAQDLGVDRERERTQAAGGVQEERGRVVHQPKN